MPRTKKSTAHRKTRKRVLKSVKGHRASAGHLYRLAREASVRAGVNAFIDRKRKKREFRGLWIVRLSAACKARGLRYSQFIAGCKKAGIGLNRKMLSEIAIADSAGFDAITEQVKAAIA